MLIQRSVFTEVARTFLLALTGLTSAVFFMLAVVFMKRTPGVGLGFLVEIFPLFFPLALQFTVPLSLLVAVVMTFSRIAGSGELTALAANGVKPTLVTGPVLAGAAALALAAFLLTDLATPFAAQRLRAAKRDLIHQLHTSFRSGLRDLDLGKGRISFESFHGSEFTDVCVEWIRSEDDYELWRAKRGSIVVTDDDRVILALEDAQQSLPRATKYGRAAVSVGDIVVEQSLHDLVGQASRNRKRGGLTAAELAHVGARELPPGYGRVSAVKAMEEFARRSALAASTFFFALVGIPLGVLTSRGGRVGAALFGIGPVLVGYFSIVVLGSQLARSGRLPAYPALWCGNALLLVLGTLLLRRIARR